MRFALVLVAILGLMGCNTLDEIVRGPAEPQIVDIIYDELCETPPIERCHAVIGRLQSDADVAKNQRAAGRLDNIRQETDPELCATEVRAWAAQTWGERRNLRGEMKHPHCDEG